MKLKIHLKLLALLGFSGIVASCTTTTVISCEYGSPYAEFSFKGKVTDTNNSPLKEIRVVIGSADFKQLIDTVYTDSNGSYLIDLQYTTFKNDGEVLLRAVDVTGNEVGTLFNEQIKPIAIQESDYQGGNGWNNGRVEKEVDFVLTQKTDSEE